MKKYYTVPEVGRILGRTGNTVRLWITDGRLPAVKFQGRFLVEARIINSLLKAGYKPANPETCFPGACECEQVDDLDENQDDQVDDEDEEDPDDELGNAGNDDDEVEP